MDFLFTFLFHSLEHLVSNRFLVDGILIVLGFVFGRYKGVFILLRVAIEFYRMVKHYQTTHPKGRAMAALSNADEKLDKLYQDKLEKYDSNTQSCLGAGNVPNAAIQEVG